MTDTGMGIVVGTKTCILTRTLSTPTRVPAGLPLPMSNTNYCHRTLPLEMATKLKMNTRRDIVHRPIIYRILRHFPPKYATNFFFFFESPYFAPLGAYIIILHKVAGSWCPLPYHHFDRDAWHRSSINAPLLLSDAMSKNTVKYFDIVSDIFHVWLTFRNE